MNKIETCKCTIINKELVDKVKSSIPEEEVLYDVAELFKVFGDSTRIKIICVLFKAEMCVCDIASILKMSHSAVSHQLRVLKNARLIRNRKQGKTVYYSLADDHVKRIFDQGLSHVLE